MSSLSLQMLAQLADASVRSLGLALVACLAVAILRTRHAAARHAVWSAVLTGMLALPVLTPMLPRLAVRGLQRPAVVRNAIQQGSGTALGSRNASPKLPPTPIVPAWPAILAGVYLAGLVLSLTRILSAWHTCRRLVKHSAPIHDRDAQDLLATIAASQSVARPLPQLCASHSVFVPMTFGSRQPVILLPANWRSWDAWKLRAVLAHELSHVRRRDWPVTVAASLNRCLYWFHPLAWWLEHHLSALAEQASDDAALAGADDPARYARTVLDFAEALQDSGRLVPGVAMARTTKVSRRIDRILALRTPGPAVIGKTTWAAIVACALPLVYSAAALQITQPGPQRILRPGPAQVMIEGSKLSAIEAQQLETQLASGADAATYGRLISYYSTNGMADRFREHVYALITKHPESDIALYASHLQSGLDPDRLKVLWIDAAASHPNEAAAVGNAALYIGDTDPYAEANLLKRARQLDPVWVNHLADLFARAISHRSAGQPAFAESAGVELETSSDATLVGLVGEFLSAGPAGGRGPEPAQLELAGHLLQRSQTLEPDNQEWSAALDRLRAPREDTGGLPPGVVRIRVGAAVQQGNLVQQPVPIYPQTAKQAHVQGLVRFNVVIGKDGHIGNMSLISGHPLLIPAAEDAVKQWVYRPTLLNGDPVEVATVIDIQFTLMN